VALQHEIQEYRKWPYHPGTRVIALGGLYKGVIGETVSRRSFQSSVNPNDKTIFSVVQVPPLLEECAEAQPSLWVGRRDERNKQRQQKIENVKRKLEQVFGESEWAKRLISPQEKLQELQKKILQVFCEQGEQNKEHLTNDMLVEHLSIMGFKCEGDLQKRLIQEVAMVVLDWEWATLYSNEYGSHNLQPTCLSKPDLKNVDNCIKRSFEGERIRWPTFFDEDTGSGFIRVEEDLLFHHVLTGYEPQQLDHEGVAFPRCISMTKQIFEQAGPPGLDTVQTHNNCCHPWHYLCNVDDEPELVKERCFHHYVRPAFSRAVCAVLNLNPFELPSENCLSFLMAQHIKLGGSSSAFGLPTDVLQKIFNAVKAFDKCEQCFVF
jgi:hypothetical protein